MARADRGARCDFSLRPDARVPGTLRAQRHDQHQPVRLDVLYAYRLSWPARADGPRRSWRVAGYRDERAARRDQAVGFRVRRDVLAFRRRGVGSDLRSGLSVAADSIGAVIR